MLKTEHRSMRGRRGLDHHWPLRWEARRGATTPQCQGIGPRARDSELYALSCNFKMTFFDGFGTRVGREGGCSRVSSHVFSQSCVAPARNKQKKRNVMDCPLSGAVLNMCWCREGRTHVALLPDQPRWVALGGAARPHLALGSYRSCATKRRCAANPSSTSLGSKIWRVLGRPATRTVAAAGLPHERQGPVAATHTTHLSPKTPNLKHMVFDRFGRDQFLMGFSPSLDNAMDPPPLVSQVLRLICNSEPQPLK